MRPASVQSVLASAAVFAAGTTLRAQSVTAPDGGPVVVGERKQLWKPVELARFGMGLEFYGQARTDTLDQKNGSNIIDRQNTLRGTVDFDFEAFLGHKNLVDLTGVANLGLEDQHIDSEAVGTTSNTTELYNTYDISALILGATRLPVTAYTRRNQDLLDRAFAGSLNSTTSQSGVIANIVSEVAPTTLHYFHLDTDQSDDLGRADFRQIQDSFAANSTISVTENNRLELVYTFDNVSVNQSGDFSNPYDQQDFAATDTYTFGGTKQNQLRSYFRYYDQTGLTPQQILRLDEQLLLQHSEKLQSRYNFTAERQEISGVEQWLLRGNANVRHQLFDSLISTGSFTGEGFYLPGEFRSNQWTIQGGLEYTKKVGIGRLDATVGAGFTAQHNGDRGNDITVLNEPHIVDQPFPVVISRRNIVAGSVSVSNATGFPTYAEGSDFTVAYFPDRAEITVIIGGNIVDGQSILVDYTIGPEPSSDIDSLNTTVSVRYTITEGTFDGLAFFTIFRTQNFNISTADPSLFVLDDYNDFLYGTEYRRGGVHLLAQQNIHDSTTDPYDNTRLEASYDLRLGPESSVGLELSRELINYDNPGNDVTLDRVTGRWNQRFSRQWELELRLDYFNQKNELQGESRGFDQYLELRWRRGQTTAYTTISNQLLFTDPSNQTSQILEVGLRRQF